VKTGDTKVDNVLAQIEAGRVRVSDRVRLEIDELAGALDSVPDSHPDRPDTLAALREVISKVTDRHEAIADPFIDDPRNEKYDYEDGQGNLVTRETDARNHVRETITMNRSELATKRARQRQADETLAEAKELFGEADEFTKAAADSGGVQAEALKARADELRTEARAKKQALRDAGVKIKPAADELMRRRDASSEEVANVLALSRSGQFGEALDAARALDRQRLHELRWAADEREDQLFDILKHESSVDMTSRAIQGGQIIREGLRGDFRNG
jgi:ElaB/YqjD/DUF883 family membrane-anchored ribosome-binding protein